MSLRASNEDRLKGQGTPSGADGADYAPPIRAPFDASGFRHPHLEVEGNRYCGTCGAGRLHAIHHSASGVESPAPPAADLVPEEEGNRTDKPVDSQAELTRLEHLIAYAVDEADQGLRGAEPLLHKAIALALVNSAKSLERIANSLERRASDEAGLPERPSPFAYPIPIEALEQLREMRRRAPGTWTCTSEYFNLMQRYCALDHATSFKVITAVNELLGPVT